MRALTVSPGRKNSAKLEELPEPPIAEGAILTRALALGICGTDHEILDGDYGWAPDGASRLILGHESLGLVEEAPPGSGFSPGDLIVGIVRRPDPVPCRACAIDEWDMCRNGLYTERGIKSRNGFCSEKFRIEPDFAVKIDPALGPLGVLLEPTSVVAKAWEQVMRAGSRTASWKPERVLVTGAGPVGLLAALLGAQRRLDVHVFDRHEDGPKPGIVRALGATYHAGDASASGRLAADIAPDIVIECTGASAVVIDVMNGIGAGGIVCLAGVSSGGRCIEIDMGALNRSLVLENEMVFGTVNANRRHYEAAATALAAADRAWLESLVSRRVPLSKWREALTRRPDDIKVVIDFTLEEEAHGGSH